MDALTQLSQKLLTDVKTSLGDAFATLPVSDRTLIAEVCEDAARLQIDSLAFPADAASAKILAERKADIDAQLDNIAAMESSVSQQAFWNIVSDVMATASHVLVKVALGAVAL
jgi:hypothetical protein